MSKEVTRVITAEITVINTFEDLSNCLTKEEAKEKVVTSIKRSLGADSVVVTNVQDFIRDKGGANDGRCEVDQDSHRCLR